MAAGARRNMHDSHSLDRFDALLAQHRPFGDSDYLHEQLQVRYKHRLTKISALLPAAGELSCALDEAHPDTRYRVVGNPVVRHAIQQALRHVVHSAQDHLSLAECEEVFRETIRHLEQGRRGGPLESGAGAARRLGAEPFHGWIWSEEHGDDVFGRLFRRIVGDHFPGEPLCTPSAADRARLAKGTASSVRFSRRVRGACWVIRTSSSSSLMPVAGRERDPARTFGLAAPSSSTERCFTIPGGWPTVSCTNRSTRSSTTFARHIRFWLETSRPSRAPRRETQRRSTQSGIREEKRARTAGIHSVPSPRSMFMSTWPFFARRPSGAKKTS